MKLRAFALCIVLALYAVVLAGCGKTSDLPAMQDEANGVVTMYKPRFEHLEKRVVALEDRSRRIPPQTVVDPASVKDVQRLFSEANTKLNEMKGEMASAANRIKAAATPPDESKPADANKNPRTELLKLTGELRERFETGHTEINAKLDSVESWLATLEWRPLTATTPPPPPPPAPEPASPPGDPAGAGSAGPT
jgi:hypothetical protein